ncbi:MAG TPA: hypothetical protein VKM55_02500 [Candidatus Lokiarchaeia archaeon]|nr:hypothetical protein [Candidatus Lokiarchaeia archaeon]
MIESTSSWNVPNSDVISARKSPTDVNGVFVWASIVNDSFDNNNTGIFHLGRDNVTEFVATHPTMNEEKTLPEMMTHKISCLWAVDKFLSFMTMHLFFAEEE